MSLAAVPSAIPIADAADSRLDDFRDLMQADATPERRPVLIAEGVNVVERLVRSPYRVRAIAGVASKLEALSPVLERLDAPVYLLDKWTLSDVVGFRVTRGVVATADRPEPSTAASVLARGSRFVVLETINDLENLGSIFRNAAAFGVDGVLLNAQCADPLYRRSLRVSMGHVFGLPFAVLPDPWPESLALLAKAGVKTIALTPRASAPPITEIRPPDKWAILLGAEGPGLTEASLVQTDLIARIPMADGVDSLNVATAGAVALAQLVAESR